MLRPDLNATIRTAFIALVLAVPACGKKDSGTTVDTGSSAATTTAVKVTEVKVGRSIGADKRIADETEQFRPTDVIYAVVETSGSGPNTDLRARWTYEDGQLVDETSRTISASGEDATEFHISKPSGWPKGKYKVEVLLNGNPVESEEFSVK